MEATTDLWEIPPESATRVGHPAPFPVELPERLIHLYTYRNDLVLDPFVGSGTTALAAVRTERHFAGYDTDPDYVRAARDRVAEEKRRARGRDGSTGAVRVAIGAVPGGAEENGDFQAHALRDGKSAREFAEKLLADCGFARITSDVRFPEGVEVSFRATDGAGMSWFFDVSGAFTSSRPGLRKNDTLFNTLGKAAVLRETHPDIPLVLLTTEAPAAGSAGDSAIKVMSGTGKPIRDVIELLSREDQKRLREYGAGEGH
jgi:site-specific DNA-methyltransferase (adenine-specific)